MNQTQHFGVGDSVWWFYSDTTMVEYGRIEWIQGCLMSIREPDVGTCKVSITAGRVEGRWLVHRSYQGYQEPLYKDCKGVTRSSLLGGRNG